MRLSSLEHTNNLVSLVFGLALSLPLIACGPDEGVGASETAGESGASETSGGDDGVCEPLAEQACVCDDGSEGIEICDPSGDFWGECMCEPPPECGDMLCEEAKGEDCYTCELDCGMCNACGGLGEQCIEQREYRRVPKLEKTTH